MPSPKHLQTADLQVNLSRVLATTMRHWQINTEPAPHCILQGAARLRRAPVQARRRIQYDLQFAW